MRKEAARAAATAARGGHGGALVDAQARSRAKARARVKEHAGRNKWNRRSRRLRARCLNGRCVVLLNTVFSCQSSSYGLVYPGRHATRRARDHSTLCDVHVVVVATVATDSRRQLYRSSGKFPCSLGHPVCRDSTHSPMCSGKWSCRPTPAY